MLIAPDLRPLTPDLYPPLSASYLRGPLQSQQPLRLIRTTDYCPEKGDRIDLNSDLIVPVDSQNKPQNQSSIKKTTDKTLEF